MMTTLRLDGLITKSGTLELELPRNLPAGKATVTIEIPTAEDWLPEELDGLLRVEPISGAKIVEDGLTGGWAHESIGDGQVWVEEQRQERRARRQW